MFANGTCFVFGENIFGHCIEIVIVWNAICQCGKKYTEIHVEAPKCRLRIPIPNCEIGLTMPCPSKP